MFFVLSWQATQTWLFA